MDDTVLLREYVESHSERAFGELVARHLPRVLATAQRLMREPHAANDVAQAVFIQLARKAWTIREGQVLSGWLYRTTRHVAFNLMREEHRRQKREATAMKDIATHTTPEPGWAELAPLVDEAMKELKRPEQDVVLLRFFEGKSFGEIGRQLKVDEKTAGQRAHRALEKMRLYFASRGVTTTAVLLGSRLSTHAAALPSAGMPAQVAGASLAGTAASSSTVALLKTLYMTASTKLLLTAAVFITAAAVVTISQQREISRLREEAASARVAARPDMSANNRTLSLTERLARAKAAIAWLQTISEPDISATEISNYVKTLDLEIVKALLEDLSQKTDLQAGGEMREFFILTTRWGVLDPQGALAWVRNLPDSRLRTFGIQMIFGGWSSKDPAAAFNAMMEDKTATGIGNLPTQVIMNYARQDPAAALAALRKLPQGQLADFNRMVFQVWAGEDPLAAAAGAIGLPPSLNRMWAEGNVARVWAARDSAAALAWVKTLPIGPEQNYALSELLGVMSQNDPSSAIGYALNLPADMVRDRLIESITDNWARQDPAALLAWADKNLTGKAYDAAVTITLRQMGRADPAAAAATLAQISDPNIVNEIIPTLASDWAKKDPPAALAWAQALPVDNTVVRNSAIANVFGDWILADPMTAGNFVVQNFAGDPSFNNLATQVVENWAYTDPLAALKWAQNLPTGPMQNNAIATALTQLVHYDPQAAWQEAQKLAGSDGGKAQVSVISAWAKQQPAQAVAALQSLLPGENLDTATANVAKSWLSQNPNAASQWINTLAQGSARDAAVTQIISTVGANDPAAAFNWAVSIGNETTRNAQVVKLATQWSGNNAAAAAAAAQAALLNLTNLTASQQAALQKVVDKAAAP